jgi:hypothetical protein
MKISTSKNLFAAVAAVLGLGLAQQAVAHDQIGTLLSGSGTKATDYYVATCAPDPNLPGTATGLFFQIKDTTGGSNMVGMTVINNSGPLNLKAATTIDAIGGDPVYSAGQTIAAGEGAYLITVFHTGIAANEGYTFIYHCQDAAGNHTGTTITRLSNQ